VSDETKPETVRVPIPGYDPEELKRSVKAEMRELHKDAWERLIASPLRPSDVIGIEIDSTRLTGSTLVDELRTTTAEAEVSTPNIEVIHVDADPAQLTGFTVVGGIGSGGGMCVSADSVRAYEDAANARARRERIIESARRMFERAASTGTAPRFDYVLRLAEDFDDMAAACVLRSDQK